jgi:hypothetical protein
MRIRPNLLLALILSFSLINSLNAQTTGGLQTAVSIDTLGRLGSPYEGNADKLEVREAEVLFFAPIDALWDGMLNLAAHQESGQSFFEVHEAYLTTSRWIPRSRFKIGQYFLGIGRLNSFHRHDWPFVSAPRVQREFFDSEGINDTGVEWSTLLPTDQFWEVTAGLTSGWTFGHSHNLGAKPTIPTLYAKITGYSDIGENGGSQYGLNWLIRKDSNQIQTQLLGFDITAKWREGRVLKWLVQGELWARNLQYPNNLPSEWSLGSYLFVQYATDPQWHYGLRLESIGNLSLETASGKALPNTDFAFVPTITFRNSEFSLFRAAYTLGLDREPGDPFDLRQSLELQVTFNLGAHPAHDF